MHVRFGRQQQQKRAFEDRIVLQKHVIPSRIQPSWKQFGSTKMRNYSTAIIPQTAALIDQVCPQRNATASFRLFQSHRTQEN